MIFFIYFHFVTSSYLLLYVFSPRRQPPMRRADFAAAIFADDEPRHCLIHAIAADIADIFISLIFVTYFQLFRYF